MADFEAFKLGEAIPVDAVVVSICRGMGRTVADVMATNEIAGLPMPVPRALATAEALRTRIGLERIVVVLDDPTLWRNDWGRLLLHPV